MFDDKAFHLRARFIQGYSTLPSNFESEVGSKMRITLTDWTKQLFGVKSGLNTLRGHCKLGTDKIFVTFYSVLYESNKISQSQSNFFSLAR